MGTSRELREEEIRLNKIFVCVRNLDKMLWNGKFLLEDVKEEIDLIKYNLDEIYNLLKRRKYKND